MIDIRHCDFVYVAGYNDNAMGEAVRSEKHFVELPYAFTTALNILDRCDHAVIISDDNEEIPYIYTSPRVLPSGTILIDRKE